MRIENMNEVIEELNKDRDEDEVVEYKRVGDVVNDVANLGFADNVRVFSDKAHHLDDNLSQELLAKEIDKINEQDNEQLDNFLNQLRKF